MTEEPTIRGDNDLAILFLGAGRGSRLLPYTVDRPKWLLPVRRMPILHTLAAIAHSAGLTDVALVRAASAPDPDLPCIAIVDNPDDFNMVNSLFKAERYFRQDFIMSYADILYEPRVLGALLDSTSDVSVVIDSNWLDYYRLRTANPFDAAESLRLDGTRIVEIGRPLTASSALPEGQYIGLVRFRGAGLQALVDTYHELARTHAGKPWRHAARFETAFMTDMLQELIDRGVDVRAVPIEHGWVEFDTREDYERILAADVDGEAGRYIDLDTLPVRPTVLSAGGVLWRDGASEVEVLLVAQGHPPVWRLPKGMQDRGELIRTTAEREVAEETGVRAQAGVYLGERRWTYQFNHREWDEICRFYLMDGQGGEPVMESTDTQIVDMTWMTLQNATDALGYGGEKDILRVAARVLAGRGGSQVD